MGYATKQCGYVCIALDTKRFYISKHIVFIETCFPFAQGLSNVPQFASSIPSTFMVAPSSIPLISSIKASSPLNLIGSAFPMLVSFPNSPYHIGFAILDFGTHVDDLLLGSMDEYCSNDAPVVHVSIISCVYYFSPMC